MTEKKDNFIKICKINDLQEKTGKKFFVDDVEIAVFKVDGKIYALNNICPHQHAAIIYDGFVENCKVVCPSHGWEFNLSDGTMAQGRKGLDSYKVNVVDGEVYVKVYKKEPNW